MPHSRPLCLLFPRNPPPPKFDRCLPSLVLALIVSCALVALWLQLVPRLRKFNADLNTLNTVLTNIISEARNSANKADLEELQNRNYDKARERPTRSSMYAVLVCGAGLQYAAGGLAVTRKVAVFL